jgi:hypothetical protein
MTSSDLSQPSQAKRPLAREAVCYLVERDLRRAPVNPRPSLCWFYEKGELGLVNIDPV